MNRLPYSDLNLSSLNFYHNFLYLQHQSLMQRVEKCNLEEQTKGIGEFSYNVDMTSSHPNYEDFQKHLDRNGNGYNYPGFDALIHQNTVPNNLNGFTHQHLQPQPVVIPKKQKKTPKPPKIQKDVIDYIDLTSSPDTSISAPQTNSDDFEEMLQLNVIKNYIHAETKDELKENPNSSYEESSEDSSSESLIIDERDVDDSRAVAESDLSIASTQEATSPLRDSQNDSQNLSSTPSNKSLTAAPNDFQSSTNATFRCEFCSRKFTSKRRLDHHNEKSHTRKLIYRCKFCRSSFKTKRKLMRHEYKSHIDKISSNMSQRKSSMFHNVELMAQSDCKSLEEVVVAE